MSEIITRNFVAEFRAFEESGLIEGVPIVFDTPTDIGGLFQETICSGAISEEVLSRDILFFFNHNLNALPVGRSIIPLDKLGGVDFQLFDGGVRMRANPNRKRTDANDLYLSIQDETVTGMSFMFGVAEERWEDRDTDYPKRFITKIDPIVEVSAVTFPAYSSTSIQTRGLSDALDSAKKSLESERERLRGIERRKQKIKILTEVL